MNKEIDNIETLILMALDGNTETTDYAENAYSLNDGTQIGLFDQSRLVKCDDMRPSQMFTFDMCDDDRLYSADPNDLMQHPVDIIRDEAEIFFYDGNQFKWVGYRKTKKPKGIATLGKADAYFEAHYRFIRNNGVHRYAKRVIPINKKGYPLPAKIKNQFICTPDIEGSYLNIACSMIEDAHRSNAMLATFEDGVKVHIPVPLDNYQEIFFDREAPLIKGRKKAIIHWVAKHIRKSKQGNWHSVKKHVRGVKDIVIDGMTVNISPNGYA